MKVCGIDPSLRSTGISTEEHGEEVLANDLRGAERLAWIIDQISERLHGITHIALESLSFGSKGQLTKLAELQGIIKLEAYRRGIEVVPVPPTTLKKWATGSGKATKLQMVRTAEQMSGNVYEGKGADDMADAFLLRQYAQDQDFLQYRKEQLKNQHTQNQKHDTIDTCKTKPKKAT